MPQVGVPGLAMRESAPQVGAPGQAMRERVRLRWEFRVDHSPARRDEREREPCGGRMSPKS